MGKPSSLDGRGLQPPQPRVEVPSDDLLRSVTRVTAAATVNDFTDALIEYAGEMEKFKATAGHVRMIENAQSSAEMDIVKCPIFLDIEKRVKAAMMKALTRTNTDEPDSANTAVEHGLSDTNQSSPIIKVMIRSASGAQAATDRLCALNTLEKTGFIRSEQTLVRIAEDVMRTLEEINQMIARLEGLPALQGAHINFVLSRLNPHVALFNGLIEKGVFEAIRTKK